MPPAWEPSGGMPALKITNVKTICTAPDGIRLVVVKVETSEPGLYGLGCATFTQRPLAVVTAVEQYLKPFVIGRDPNDIEDIWQAAYVSSYWRSGPILNNAMSGIDQALWDIKAKRAGDAALPVVRRARPARRRRLRPLLRPRLPGGRGPGTGVHGAGPPPHPLPGRGDRATRRTAAAATAATRPLPPMTRRGRRIARRWTRRPWEPRPYCRIVPKLFEHMRSALGEEVELLHDVHERVPPIMAIQLAKDLEQFKLFFLEDIFAPEDNDYFRILRQQCAVPIAMGELFVNQHEYVPLIRDRLIDFIRVHISDIGGLTPARKLGILCEFFGVRTAWHGPGDTSPVGHAANLQLDLSSTNFGIQEASLFGERTKEVFPGCPEIRDGAMWSNEQPGLGIDVDEALAAKYPFPEHPINGAWPEIRRRDGTVQKP